MLDKTWHGKPDKKALPPKEEERVRVCLERFGNDFNRTCITHFPTIYRENVYPTLLSAILADTPTLQFTDRVYGKDASLWWLEKQLRRLVTFIGLLDKMSTYQRMALASALRSEAVEMCVTLSEMTVFFSRFEKGKYKKFIGYEHPNPQVITESFELFLDELPKAREYAREQRRKEEEWQAYEKMRAEAVPCPEHIRNKWAETDLSDHIKKLMGIKNEYNNSNEK